MSLLRNLARGMQSLVRKEQVGRELDEELRAYQEMAAEEKMKDGMSRKEALRAVRLERGSLEVTKEVIRLCRLPPLSRELHNEGGKQSEPLHSRINGLRASFVGVGGYSCPCCGISQKRPPIFVPKRTGRSGVERVRLGA